MSAWLLNLGFAGGGAVVASSVEEADRLSGGKPEKKRKRRDSLYPDPIPDLRLAPQETDTSGEQVAASVDVAPQTGTSPNTTMAMAMLKAGIRVEKTQAEPKRQDTKRLNKAAIILLLDP